MMSLLRSSSLEMLRQFQILPLVIRRSGLPVKHIRLLRHFFVDEAPDHLPVFEEERHFVASNLEHRAAAGKAARRKAEAVDRIFGGFR